MPDKLKYAPPTIQISEFSIKDIIHASIVPCPQGDEPCDEQDLLSSEYSLDDKILNGAIK